MDERQNAETIKEEIRKVLSCHGNHSCRDNPEGICPVTSVISDDMIFVENKKHPQCPYYTPFGYGGFCNFLLRQELYQKYGK